jgi:uncharacterized protein YhbP (UPF0306 family)
MTDTLSPIRSMLRDQTTLFLATTSKEGVPRSTPLFFIADNDLNLYWFSSRSSLHSRHCQDSPEISVAISTDARTWRQIKGVQMQGHVSIVADRTLRKTVTAAYVKRFELGKFLSLAIRRSSLYRFTPQWLRYLDNSRRFGYKFEATLTSKALPNGI